MSKILLNSKVAFKGRYRFVVRDARTHNIKRETDWIDNVITNGGLNRLGSGATISKCCIGTGTTTPDVTDSQLATFAASTTTVSTSSGNLGSPTYTAYTIQAFRFAAGTLNGNYSEVGVGWADTSLWSRALILDGGGSPTTITVLSTEYLDVYYELRMIPPLDDVPTAGVIITGSGTYTVTRRAQYAGTSPNWTAPYSQALSFGNRILAGTGGLAAITSGSGSYYSNTGTDESYVDSSYERISNYFFGLDTANASLTWFGTAPNESKGASFQFAFDAPIVKTNIQTLNIRAKISWARV